MTHHEIIYEPPPYAVCAAAELAEFDRPLDRRWQRCTTLLLTSTADKADCACGVRGIVLEPYVLEWSDDSKTRVKWGQCHRCGAMLFVE